MHIRYGSGINWGVHWRDLCDKSVLGLLLSNLMLIIWAMWQRWPLVIVMWVYWTQSVIIGIFWFFTILTYKKLTGKDPVGVFGRLPGFGAVKRFAVGLLFLFHYGLFHYVYMYSLRSGAFSKLFGSQEVVLPLGGLVIFGGVFFINQFFSFLRDRGEHRKEEADAKKLMSFPYIRILPMHFIMVFGRGLQSKVIGGQLVLLFFLLLKTVVDVTMYVRQKKGFAKEPDDRRTDDSGPRLRETSEGPELVMPGERVISLSGKPELVKKVKAIMGFPAEVRLEVCEKIIEKEIPPEERPSEAECRCIEIDFLTGSQAQSYSEHHLKLVRTAEDGSKSEYVCPRTGKQWIKVAGCLKAEQPATDEVLCRCREIEHLEGERAHRYAREHLKAVQSDGGWKTVYVCPYTDKRWLLDFTKLTDVDMVKYSRLRVLPLKGHQSGG